MEAVSYITGNVGTEVEDRGNGVVASFRLACTPRVKTKGEWVDGATTWIEVKCFRGLADHVRASIRKGDPVVVVGKLRTNTWEKDGQVHERLQIEADIVGHDLNLGTSSFRRPARAAATPGQPDHDRPDRDQAGRDRFDPDQVEPPPDEVDAAGLSPEERAAQAA